MKKLVSLLLSGLLLVSIAGCSSAPKTEGETGTTEGDATTEVLKIAGLDGGYGTAGWEAVAKAFEEKEGVKVELQLEKNIAETLRPVITSGKNVPDIIYLSVGSEGKLTDAMVAEKQITDITDVLAMTIPGEEGTVQDKILPGFTDALTSSPYGDGKLYLAPMFYSPCGLFYNAGLFEEKGWEVPTTWDQMWELGDKAKAEGIALFTYPTTGYFDAFFSALINATAGPEVYTKLMNYDADAWQLPEVKQAFEIVGKLASYTEENTVANANKDGFTKNQQLILDNKALFCPNGTWLPGEMAEAPRAENFKWGFTALPAVKDGGDGYSTTFSEQMYIPTSATNPELAKKFIAFAYSDEATKLFIENGGAVMPTTTASGMLAGTDNELYYSVYDNGAKANAVGFAAHDAVEGVDLTSAEGIIYGTVNSVVTGDKTVEDWYNGVVEAVKKFN
ncbi:carbohydrate ABC transporter substrate-binding protein [Anaerorhabdus sp.]|uniref:carbohydrate ABC transporter substrate-binding protein n=1 Tax=Anaerorhabdus sp. TaxID=1872524 RepID=UPI002FCB0113